MQITYDDGNDEKRRGKKYREPSPVEEEEEEEEEEPEEQDDDVKYMSDYEPDTSGKFNRNTWKTEFCRILF